MQQDMNHINPVIPTDRPPTPTTADIDDEINNFSQQIQKSFRDATHKAQNQNQPSAEDLTLRDLIKQKNKRRKRSKKKLSILSINYTEIYSPSTLIRKHIIESKNQK